MMAADIIPGFEETAEDIAYGPQPDCCEGCDDERDFAEWEEQVSS